MLHQYKTRPFKATIKGNQAHPTNWDFYFATVDEALNARNAELRRRGQPETKRTCRAGLCFICDGPPHVLKPRAGEEDGGVLGNCPVVLLRADAVQIVAFMEAFRDRRYESCLWSPLSPLPYRIALQGWPHQRGREEAQGGDRQLSGC
jgi:hypothetical protein